VSSFPSRQGGFCGGFGGGFGGGLGSGFGDGFGGRSGDGLPGLSMCYLKYCRRSSGRIGGGGGGGGTPGSAADSWSTALTRLAHA
jgi:hypothetical protein